MAINGIKPSAQGLQTGISTNDMVVESSSNMAEGIETTAEVASNVNKSIPEDLEVNKTTEDQLDKKLKDALSMANNKIKQSQPRTRCEFTYHEDMNRVSIKLIDKDTDKVVKEIPPEKTIKMIEKLWEIAGLLVDEKL